MLATTGFLIVMASSYGQPLPEVTVVHNNALANGLSDNGLALVSRPEGGWTSFAAEQAYTFNALGIRRLADDFAVPPSGWTVSYVETWFTMRGEQPSASVEIGAGTATIHAQSPTGEVVAVATLSSSEPTQIIRRKSPRYVQPEYPAGHPFHDSTPPRLLHRVRFTIPGGKSLSAGDYWVVFNFQETADLKYVGIPSLTAPEGTAVPVGNARQFTGGVWQDVMEYGPDNSSRRSDLVFLLYGS